MTGRISPPSTPVRRPPSPTPGTRPSGSTPAVGYSTFRYSVTETVGGGEHALGEIEYFGTPVPEPTTLTVLGLGALGLLARRRRPA
jgi:hypothetical protein